MNVDDMFPSRFISSEEFDNGETKTLTIRNCYRERVFDERKQDYVERFALAFAERVKPLLLNVTNTYLIAEQYGLDTDGWTGKMIRLKVGNVRSDESPEYGVRVLRENNEFVKKIPAKLKKAIKRQWHAEGPSPGYAEKVAQAQDEHLVEVEPEPPLLDLKPDPDEEPASPPMTGARHLPDIVIPSKVDWNAVNRLSRSP